MTRRVHFTKMQGAGNDYIYVNTLLYNIPNPVATSRLWSSPHFGIGADGLVLIGKPTDGVSDYSMRIFNADGSEAMMCGNASRCVGKYLYEKGITDKTMIQLQTLSGKKTIQLHLDGDKVGSVSVDMLEPCLCDKEYCKLDTDKKSHISVMALGKRFRGTFVSIGNPHFVIFCEDVEAVDVAKYGPVLERNDVFPHRCNIEFAQTIEDGKIRMRVWERGSGITMACGSGACATAVAANINGLSGRKSSVIMDGGTLEIEWRETDNHIYMTGPAEFVFEGEIELMD